MADYKLQAAQKAFEEIRPEQVIGPGNGRTILHLAGLIADDRELAHSLTIVSSSEETASRLTELGLPVQNLSDLSEVDLYFDGCDQFDSELNALKSGGGIHTMEKIIASMAKLFILVGDEEKFSSSLTGQYPVVIEVFPPATGFVSSTLRKNFPEALIRTRETVEGNGPVFTGNGNLLVELKFDVLPALAGLNHLLKMIPGVIEHSLFYRIACMAIVSGPGGTRVMVPQLL